MPADGSAKVAVTGGGAQHERRRQQLGRITSVSTKLFQRNGYESTSVNDVAASLDMSVGGLYRYIATKSDLLDLVCEDIYGDLPEELAAIDASPSPPAEKLQALVDAYLEACGRNRALILLMYREYRHLSPASQERFKERELAIATLFARVVDDGIADGSFRAVDARLLAIDIVTLGHLPALKGWALGAAGLDGVAVRESQKELLSTLLGVDRQVPRRRPARR